MKNRFNTYDIICVVTELQRLVGMRVNQVYDIDNKAYLIRLQRSEEKAVLLLESGNRLHTTQFEWPKNVAPSGFTMKLRKHLKNKRLEKLSQLGIDRIVDLQFGSGEVSYHVILELYDRGNIILTDYQWTILNVLRPHVEGDKIRFAVKEKYPLDRAKSEAPQPSSEMLIEIFAKSKPGDNLKKILNPNLEYGPAIIDHVLQENGLSGNMRITNDSAAKGFNVQRDLSTLEKALGQAEELLDAARKNIAKGYIIQKREERPNPEGEGNTFFLTNVEFHPLLYSQHKNQPYTEYETFDRAVDEFFSAFEGQKIDLKTVQMEREAMKKLQNVRNDHVKRLGDLEKTQLLDKDKAELITRNQHLVEEARIAIQSALATQMSWEDIKKLVKTAQDNKDPIASSIKDLKLNMNHITLLLRDPYEKGSDDQGSDHEALAPMLVDIDLSLTAYANARRYYDQKRNAAKKQQKTIESQGKALKSAERKTKQTLKEAQTISNISKARKNYWFEKFFWFISSDNYLVIGGRDQQQNELLVKRYMRATDIYVHADLSGAASVIVKNPSGEPLPPRTLSEAGQAAIAYSVAWEAKVLTSAWWVHANQVSKSAPTGEYLSTGSFMIRGKKNYLLPSHLMLGFSFMFRLEDSCIERHRHERRIITTSEEVESDTTSVQEQEQDGQEIPVSDDEEKSVEDDKLQTITEEIAEVDIADNESENLPENDVQTDSDTDESTDDIFPNTHIKVDHDTGKVIIENKTRTISQTSDDKDDEKPLVFPSLSSKETKGRKKKTLKKEEFKPKENQFKRGQKSKLKKIKEKYKDQDEEDKAFNLQLLQSAGSAKEPKKVQKGKSGKGRSEPRPKIPQPAPVIFEAEDDEPEEAEIEVEAQTGNADTEMLSQLTGSPYQEDELLFAVPVVAPYSVLHNYKFKVKLTPGNSKRGKAAKTAIQVFLKDKACTPRERDLLKAVKEENVARNFPGKVKLSAPQLTKHKK